MASLLRRLPTRSMCLIVVAALSVTAGAAAVYATANGPWGGQDSVAYILSARNLMMGDRLGYLLPDGAFQPLRQFPPFYPVMLGMIGLLGPDLAAAARWLNILLFMGTIFVAGLIFIRHSSAPELSVAAGLLLASFPAMTHIFSSSLSEPLFIFLLLSAVLCLLEYSKSNARRWLVLCAVFTSLAPLTRYVGIALLPVMVATLFLFAQAPWKDRLRKAISFGFITSLPILWWGLAAFSGEAAPSSGWGLRLDAEYASSQASEFFYTVMQFTTRWVPFGASLQNLQLRYLYGISIVFLAGIAAAAFLADRQIAGGDPRQRASRDLELVFVSWAWIVAYFALLALTTFLTTAVPAISNRMLLPIYVGVVLTLTSGLAVIQDAWFLGTRRWLRALPWVIALWGTIYYIPQTVAEIILPLHVGAGTTSYLRRTSETMAAVRDLPDDVPIVSNDPHAIGVWAGRPAYNLIENLQASFIDQDARYGADPADPAQIAFREGGAALVIFEREFPRQLEEAFGENGRQRLQALLTGLVVGGRYEDGTIYYSP